MRTVDIKGKPYVEVNERIKHFRKEERYDAWSITTEVVSHDGGAILFKASVLDSGNNVMATGHAREKDGDGYINKTSYVENCETSAIGRALGCLGIGIDTSIASADEVATAVNNQQKSTPPAKPKPKASKTLFWDALQAKAQKDGVKPSDLTKPIIRKIIADIGEAEGLAMSEEALDLIVSDSNNSAYPLITRQIENYDVKRAIGDFKQLALKDGASNA
jgi:hypothetical protein